VKIEILNNRVDSLNSLLSNERSSNSLKISDLTSDIKTKETQISILIENTVKLNDELQASKAETQLKQREISELKSEITKLKDSLHNLKIERIPPFKYGKIIYSKNDNKYYSTVFFDFIDIPQVLTDSLTVKFNEDLMYSFYFFISIADDLNIQCPMDFGYVVYDKRGTEIFKNLNPKENYFAGYLEFDLGLKKRRLIGLGSSGCGSGGSISYYELDIYNGQLIQNKKFGVSTGGYETTFFLPQRKIYVYLERLNPEAHWSGDTRYALTVYSLIDDKLIGIKETNYIYPHFGDVVDDELLKIIESREPNILEF
jgi:hypothetical protein